MDTSKFLGKFKDATEDHLQRMNELLLRLEQDPRNQDEIAELLREIHTLKGESRMMGFGDMSDVAHAIEDVLKRHESEGFVRLSEVTDALFEGFDVVQGLLDEKLGGEPKGHDVEGTCARLAGLAGSEPAMPTGQAGASDRSAAAPASDEGFGDLDLGELDLPDGEPDFGPAGVPEGVDPAAAMAEAFGIPAAPSEAGGPAKAGPPRVGIGGGTSKFMGKFADATRDHLQVMNRIVLDLERDPSRSSEVTELLREIHTLKGESRMMGFGDMSDLAHAIEDVLRAQAEKGFATLSRVTDALFEAFDAEQVLLSQKLGEGEASVDLPALVGRLAALARGEKAEKEAPTPPRPSVDAGTSKFMGKFADATRDHLERMNRLVLHLEARPNSPDEIAELMREVHTLKGESRMMGFGDMAELAHSTEDLLKAQEAAGFAGLASVADLIFEAFDAQGRLLEEKLGGSASGVDPARLGSRLEAAAQGGVSGAGPVAGGPAAAPWPPERPAPRDEPPPAPALPPLDPLLAQGFVESAEGQAALLRALFEGWSSTSSPRELERALRGLETEAAMAGFDELLALLAAMPKALELGRRAEATKALDSLVEAAKRRVRGEDPEPLLNSALRLLEEGAAPPPPKEAPAASAPRRPAPSSKAAPAPPPGAGLVGGRTASSRPAQAPPQPKPVPARGSPAVGRSEPPADPPPGQKGAAGSAAGRPGPDPAATKVDQTIRISLGKLEELGNVTGDIYLNHTRAVDRQRQLRSMLDVAARQARATGTLRQVLGRDGGTQSQLSTDVDLAEAYEQVLETHRALRRQLQEMLHADRDEYLHATHQIVDLRERVRALQMLPVLTLFDMYPRMVRDIAKELGKKVALQVEGGDTELDRRILDEIRDPMVHLIRNSIDHGVETPDRRERAGKPAQGTVRLAARAEGDSVVIEIEDDGAGIDPAAIRASALKKGVIGEDEAEDMTDEQAMQLIFAPGFSSKDEVSDLSGRGVGMDVVRRKVEALDGRIGVYSEVGRGTRMALRLPLTLAMARVLLLRAGGLLLAVPATFVAEVLRVAEARVRRVESYEAIEWQGRTIPIVSMANVLEREARPGTIAGRTVVVLGFEEHLVGFVADRLEGEREVVVKRLDSFLGRVKNVAGATILSSGQIVVVLHVPQLIASTMGVSPLSLRAQLREPRGEEEAAGRARRLLVVDDSIIVRDMMKGVLEGAGFEVVLAVDGMDGLEKQLAGGFDLVITDVEMPRMDGFELTRTLKQNDKQADVPIIIVTTLDSPESKAKGLQAGASAYVVKNLLDMSRLVETINRLVS